MTLFYKITINLGIARHSRQLMHVISFMLLEVGLSNVC